jgi:hypothetical protein
MNNVMRQNVAAVYVVIAAAICLLWLAPAYQEAKEQEMTTTVTWYITTELGNNTFRFDKTDEETCRKAEKESTDDVSCMSYTETLGKK